MLCVADALIMKHRRLPLMELVETWAGVLFDATGRQISHVLQGFPQPFGIGGSGSEKVGEPITGLAFRLHQAIHEIGKAQWRITGAGHRLYAELVRNLLVLFFFTGRRSVYPLQAHTLHKLVV